MVFLTKAENPVASLTQLHLLMTPWTDSIGTDVISFLNRDHIVSVTIQHGEIIVTTTAGTKITIPASGVTLQKFVDDLANHCESNFVSIAEFADTAKNLKK